MRTAKEITLLGIYTALLIGGQYVFSFISGVEIVTVLFLSFCFRFGVRRGIILGTAFSVLRCFIFGFYPTVIILYLVYYNVFAVIFGVIGNTFRNKISVKTYVLCIVLAMILTVFFTLLDDVITPVFYGFTWKSTKAYFIASFSAMIPQTVCVLITVSLLFYPVQKALSIIKLK